MNHVGSDIKGFLGGPHDTLVLTSYVDHVAARVWSKALGGPLAESDK